MIADIRKILLVEDSMQDAELTLAALHEKNLANEVVHVRDGAEALAYLARTERRSPLSFFST